MQPEETAPQARLSMETIELIATTLVNQRVMRRGSPPIANALDILPEHLRTEVMDDAEAVYDALNSFLSPS